MRGSRSKYAAKLAVPALGLALVVLLPGLLQASSHEGGSVADEIKKLILDSNEYSRKNLKDQEGGISKDGSVQFWSSGGLMQAVPTNPPVRDYVSFAITPKHIKVIELPGGEAAVAMYYAEGSFQPKGSAPVSHYMTRVLEVYVKEDGKWVNRASHWSPIAAGSGTSQTAVD